MAQPQYTYDPVTQTYTRIDADAPVQPKSGLGALYEANSAGENVSDTYLGQCIGSLKDFLITYEAAQKTA